MFNTHLTPFRVVRIFISFLLDRPLFAFALSNIVNCVYNNKGFLEPILVFVVLAFVEFYFSNVGAEYKAFKSLKSGFDLIKLVAQKATLKRLREDQILEILGDDIIREIESFKWMKVDMIRQLGMEPKLSKISDSFMVFQVSGIPLTPTAFATSSGGVAVVLIPRIREKLTAYQKFLLLHEFGHVTPTQNFYDLKRVVERVLSSFFGCLFLVFFVASPLKYLGIIFFLFRYLNLTTANYTALNECQANHFAYKRLMETEFIEVHSILKRRWEAQLSNKKDKNFIRNMSISQEIIVEKQLDYLEEFKKSESFREKIHFGRQEGFLSTHSLSLLCILLGFYSSFDFKYYFAVALLILAHIVVRGLKRKKIGIQKGLFTIVEAIE